MDGEDGWKALIELIAKIEDPEKLEEVLSLLLTHEEKRAVPQRVLIIRDLLHGEKSQRIIAKDLNVSIAKITRGSNNIKLINPALKSFLKEQLAP